jgi:predicted Zn-ribbon and HTH transcriptional regulator
MNFIEEMMNKQHEAWETSYYTELFQKQIKGKLTPEELEWLISFQKRNDYYPCPRPTTCWNCGKDLTSYDERITGCPHCHVSFVE